MGVFQMDQAAHVSEETYLERIRRAEPRHGDILYSREGTYFGIAAEVPRGVQVCLGQRMVLIRPNRRKVSSRYLYYWLNSPFLTNHIYAHRDGSVAERLNLPTIRRIPVLLPTLKEQDAVARTLGALDDKIELNRRMNQTLEAMARAIFKAWFVDFDSEPRGKHSPKATRGAFPRELPEGWSTGSLADNFLITMGQSPPGETYNEEGVGLPFFQGSSDFGFRFPQRRVFCTAPSRLARAGDTLISVRAPVGDINMALEGSCIGRGLSAIRHLSGSTSYSYYAVQCLRSEFMKFESGGTVFGSLGKVGLGSIKCVVPPTHLVEMFERTASPIDKMIENNERQSASLSILRDTLLPKLLSGEIRVKQAEKIVGEAV